MWCQAIIHILLWKETATTTNEESTQLNDGIFIWQSSFLNYTCFRFSTRIVYATMNEIVDRREINEHKTEYCAFLLTLNWFLNLNKVTHTVSTALYCYKLFYYKIKILWKRNYCVRGYMITIFNSMINKLL